MLDRNDPNYQYKRIAAAEDQLEQSGLLSYYVERYQRKYRTPPIFPPDNRHFKHIKDLRNLTKEKAYDFITTYFEMHDDWFQKQNYSLDCLIKNLNKIAPVIVKRDSVREVKSKEGVALKVGCDACWKEMTYIVPMNNVNIPSFIRCEECEKANKPRKTQKERKQFHVVLPEMPKE